AVATTDPALKDTLIAAVAEAQPFMDTEQTTSPTIVPEKPQVRRPPSILVFFAVIAITFWIVYVAARRTKTFADFYVARSSITGTQNGWALAGDYMSAASFLGIAGLISLYGYDGFMYSVGW